MAATIQIEHTEVPSSPALTFIGGVEWHAQTFTVVDSFTVSRVDLFMNRLNNPGTFTVEVRGVSATTGQPDGSSIASASVSESQIDLHPAGPSWLTFNLNVSPQLASGTTYALVMSAPAGGQVGSNGARTQYTTTPADTGYSGGQHWFSGSSGTDGNWSGTQPLRDDKFRIWGIPVWLTGTSYTTGDSTVGSDGNSYAALQDHTSSTSNEPGVDTGTGVGTGNDAWENFWDIEMGTKVRVIPFIFSSTVAYVSEFGDGYTRFYFGDAILTDGVGDNVEVVTPYAVADLPQIQHTQIGDVQWLVHNSYAPRKLTRTNPTTFSLDKIVFEKGPFLKRNDIAEKDDITMTSSVSAADATGTLTASAVSFTAENVGSLYKITQPRATVVVTQSGAGTSSTIPVFGSFTWTTHGTWTGTAKLERNENSGGWETFRVQTSSDDANIQFSSTEKEDNVLFRITVEGGVTGTISSDINVHASTQDGIVRVDSFVQGTVVNITVLAALADTNSTTRWAEGSWSDRRGYPRAVGFYEGRVVYGSTTKQPQTIWLSETDDFEDFRAGTNASDSFAITLQTTNTVRWIAALEALIVGTSGDEWRVQSNKLDTPVTPTSASAKQQTEFGSRELQAAKVRDVVLFVDFVGRKVRELTFSEAVRKHVAPDLTALAEHITKSGIVAIAHQKNPDSILWCVLSNGNLLSMTYEREQDTIGWSSHPIDGEVHSVCVIPGASEDQVWIAVGRNVEAEGRTYIERLGSRILPDDLEDAFYVDSGVTVTNDPASTTIAGLKHLVGETVVVLGDGVVYTPTAVVDASGEVTISAAVSTAQVGLAYRYKLKPMRPDFGSATGTTRGSKVKVAEMAISFVDTFGAKSGVDFDNLFDIDFLNTEWENSSGVTGLFTGDVVANLDSGFSFQNPLVVSGNGPLPCTVRAIIPRIEKTSR